MLFEAPPLEDYNWQGKSIELGIEGKVHRLNASLALQLSNAWMIKKNAKGKIYKFSIYGFLILSSLGTSLCASCILFISCVVFCIKCVQI